MQCAFKMKKIKIVKIKRHPPHAKKFARQNKIHLTLAHTTTKKKIYWNEQTFVHQ